MVATCGGTITRLAKRPPIMPKLESVMVAPRSSSGGIERAWASARIAVEASAQIAGIALGNIAQHRDNEPALCVHGHADIDARNEPAVALYQALKLPPSWCARTQTTMSRPPAASNSGTPRRSDCCWLPRLWP
jgi:hypothetical protein